MNAISEEAVSHSFNTYYDLYIPDGADGPLPLIIATHGYSGDKKSMMRLARKVNESDYVIASLQGPHQHFKRLGDPRTGKQDIGFGWLTPWKPEEAKALHHDSVTTIIDRLVGQGKVDGQRVYLLGFSQSVSLNLRYALTFPDRIAGHIGICGGIPFDLEENPIYQKDKVRAFYLGMNQDEFYPPEKMTENMARLRKVAAEVTYQEFDGGHTIAPGMFPVINDWLKMQT